MYPHVEWAAMSGSGFFTTGEIAARAGVERSTIHNRANRLSISPALWAGRVRLYDSAAADRLVANR
jgi:hypothetical protein